MKFKSLLSLLIFILLSTQFRGIRAEDIFPPFYSREVRTENDITIEKISLRPIFTVYRTLNKDNQFVFEQLQLLWPFIFYQKTNDRRFFRFYPLVFVTSKFNENGTDFDSWILPILIWGNDPIEGRHFTMLPFGGVSKGHLGKDKILFVLPPLYFRSEYKGWISTNYLFPFIQTNSGNKHDGWRVWPFYGTYKIFSDNNNTQLMEDRKFFMWPLWITQNRYLENGAVGKSFVSFPFYASYESPSKVQKMVMWPIFNKISYPKENGVLYSILWPIFKYGNGPNAKRYEIFPLYGYKQSENHVRQFFIWPFIRMEKDSDKKEKRSSFWFLPFFWSSNSIDKTDFTEKRKVKIWPLCQYNRNNLNERKFEIFSPFWFNDSKKGGFENNYADFFRVFQTNYKKNEWYSTKFLFNLISFQKDKETRKIRIFPFIYKYEKAPEKKKVSILGGLVEYSREGKSKRIKILWIPFSKKTKKL